MIAVIALIPGWVGTVVYRHFIGTDWREKDWTSVLRILALSVVGLTFYVLLADGLSLPPAIHVFASTYGADGVRPDTLASLLVPYLGHLVGGAIAGGTAAIAMRGLSRISSVGSQPCAWDHFVRESVPQHWVVVTLKTGEAYCGRLDVADDSVPQPDRDLVIDEPALYDEARRNYISMPYQHLFVPAAAVDCVATIFDPAVDRDRLSVAGNPLFASDENDRPKTNSTDISASTTF